MRPPLVWITIGFGAGLWAGLASFGAPPVVWPILLPVLVAATALARRAPFGAAIGIAGAAGLLWGGAALRARTATCAGRWDAAGSERGAVATIVRLQDPVPDSGGVVDGRVED